MKRFFLILAIAMTFGAKAVEPVAFDFTTLEDLKVEGTYAEPVINDNDEIVTGARWKPLLSVEKDGVVLTFGSSTSVTIPTIQQLNTGLFDLRLYGGDNYLTTMTVTAPEGQLLASIESVNTNGVIGEGYYAADAGTLDTSRLSAVSWRSDKGVRSVTFTYRRALRYKSMTVRFVGDSSLVVPEPVNPDPIEPNPIDPSPVKPPICRTLIAFGVENFENSGTEASGTTILGSVPINGTTIPAYKLANNFSTDDCLSGNGIILSCEGGFKAGDKVTYKAVIRSLDEEKYGRVNIASVDSEGRCAFVFEPMTDAENVYYGDSNEPTEFSFTLTSNCDKLILGRKGTTSTYVTYISVVRGNLQSADSSEIVDSKFHHVLDLSIFTPESDPAVTGTWTTGGEAGCWKPAEKIERDGYTILLSQNSGRETPAIYASSSGSYTVRVYASNTMTLTAPSFQKIHSIVFNSKGSSATTLNPSVGEEDVSDKDMLIWYSNGGVSSVSFTPDAQLRFSEMIITTDKDYLSASENTYEVQLDFSTITQDNVDGTYFDTTYTDSGQVIEYAHWQPYNKLWLNGYTFTPQKNNGTIEPAVYYAPDNQYTVRTYHGNYLTISAPSGVKMYAIDFKGSFNTVSNVLVSTGTVQTYSENNLRWECEEGAESVTLSAITDFRIRRATIIADGMSAITDPGLYYSYGSYSNCGTLPPNQIVGIGQQVTIPANYTMYLSGKTLTGWTDGVNIYIPGDKVTVSGIDILTPVFRDNEVSLDDRSNSVTIRWDFQRKNGAPAVTKGGTGNDVWVTQARINGRIIDVALPFSTANGKLTNTNWDEWARIDSGTSFQVPSCKGAIISLESFVPTTTSTINGKLIDDNLTIPSFVVAEENSAAELIIGDGSYFKWIQVKLPYIPIDLSESLFVDEPASVVWPFSDAEICMEDFYMQPQSAFDIVSFDPIDNTASGSNLHSVVLGDDVSFIKLQSANGPEDRMQWEIKPIEGLVFTPTQVSFYVARDGTDGRANAVTVCAASNGDAYSIATITPHRNNKTKEDDIYSDYENWTTKFIYTFTSEQQLLLTTGGSFIIYLNNGYAANKGLWLSDIRIEGLLNGRAPSPDPNVEYGTVYDFWQATDFFKELDKKAGEDWYLITRAGQTTEATPEDLEKKVSIGFDSKGNEEFNWFCFTDRMISLADGQTYDRVAENDDPVIVWGTNGPSAVQWLKGVGSTDEWKPDTDNNAATEEDWKPTRNALRFARNANTGRREDTYIQFPPTDGAADVTVWAAHPGGQYVEDLRVKIVPVVDGIEQPAFCYRLPLKSSDPEVRVALPNRYYKLTKADLDRATDSQGKRLWADPYDGGGQVSYRIGCHHSELTLFRVLIGEGNGKPSPEFEEPQPAQTFKAIASVAVLDGEELTPDPEAGNVYVSPEKDGYEAYEIVFFQAEAAEGHEFLYFMRDGHVCYNDALNRAAFAVIDRDVELTAVFRKLEQQEPEPPVVDPGDDPIVDPGKDSLDEIAAAAADGKLFDVNGLAVRGLPTPGLYILVDGTKTRKVVIR